MVTKPSDFIDWATGSATVTEPSSGLKSSGWSADDVVADGHINWLLKRLDEWVQYLEEKDSYIITHVWDERSNPKSFDLNDIFDTGSLFVAVGNADGTDAYIVTSTDGITWTERSNPKNYDLYGIAHNGSLFVAVGAADGTGAYIVTSSDGITWIERSNPKNFALNSVVYDSNNSLFIAVGAADGTDAYIVTSSDGITWTERSNPKNFALKDIATDNSGLLIAVGDADGTDAYIITSPDGITWTERSNPKNFRLLGVAYNQNMKYWVAGGDSDGSDAYILASNDGLSWVEQKNNYTSISSLVYNEYRKLVIGGVAIGPDNLVVSGTGREQWHEILSTVPYNSSGGYASFTSGKRLIGVGSAEGSDALIAESK